MDLIAVSRMFNLHRMSPISRGWPGTNQLLERIHFNLSLYRKHKIIRISFLKFLYYYLFELNTDIFINKETYFVRVVILLFSKIVLNADSTTQVSLKLLT